MSQGRLVLASKVGGHSELIQDGQNGFLFAPDSPAELADAVLRIMGMRQELKQTIRRAREFIEGRRTWRGSVARYTPVYKTILSDRESRDRNV
jgi:glycosyltransferase involved in cell wall biosynthesis